MNKPLGSTQALSSRTKLSTFEAKSVQGEEAYPKVRRRALSRFGPKVGDFGPEDESLGRPLVSLIVTTHNNAGTLSACLSSLWQQTYASTEIIVVDNASTDNTRAIAERYT